MLEDLIQELSKEEIRSLKLFLNRTNANKERKDVLLFDFYRKYSNLKDESEIFQKLYPGQNKNPFYRLKNRLKEDINKSLTLQYYQSNESNECLYSLALSRHFYNKNNTKLCAEYLKKAEKQSLAINNFELLEIIYSDFIKLTQVTLNKNPEVYIQKRKEVREEIQKIRSIDDILAVLVYKIKTSQNYGKQNLEILYLLKQTISKFSSEKEIKKSPALRFKIYHAVSRMLVQEKDFKSLEEYLTKSFKEFTNERLFSKNNHETKLQLLTYLCNSLFKNDKHKKSLKYSEDLKVAIKEFDLKSSEKYWFYYYNIQIINYSAIDRNKALWVVNEAKNDKIVSKTPINSVFLALNEGQLYYGLQKFDKAKSAFVALKHLDAFNKLDQGFKLKIDIAELLMRYELNDFDYIEYYVKLIQKDYKEQLKDPNYLRQNLIIEIIMQMIYVDSKSSDKIEELKSRLYNSANDKIATDIDIINYNTWLKSKNNPDSN